MTKVLVATSFGPGKEYALPLCCSVLDALCGVDDALVCWDGLDQVVSSGLFAACSTRVYHLGVTPPGDEISIHGRLANMREQARQFFLQGDWTHLYWHDSDMVPPADIVTRLLAWGAPVANGLYLMRGMDPPVFPMLTRRNPFAEGRGKREEGRDNSPSPADREEEIGKREEDNAPSPDLSRGERDNSAPAPGDLDDTSVDELEYVDGCLFPLGYGMGCMLVDRATLEATPFRAPEYYQAGRYGEDIRWCLDCDVPILVDTQLRVWHVDGDGNGILPRLEIAGEGVGEIREQGTGNREEDNTPSPQPSPEGEGA